MSDIQRYVLLGGYDPRVVDEGPWVTYADHVAAVAAAEQRVKSDFAKYLRHMVDDDKYAAGIKAARDAVKALPELPGGLEAFIYRRTALAAIDGVKGEQ